MIRTGVLPALGTSTDLLRVTVVPLWGNHFRVNVWTGDGVLAAAIPESFFVTADANSYVLGAEPPIRRGY